MACNELCLDGASSCLCFKARDHFIFENSAPVLADYSMKEKLGKGSFSSVHLAIHKRSVREGPHLFPSNPTLEKKRGPLTFVELRHRKSTPTPPQSQGLKNYLPRMVPKLLKNKHL
eukprot:4944276-Amphidinium_carterae.1